MTKEMIISSNDHETRVAILEDDLVAELFVERERSRGVAGNVYKGRVSKVLPGMQSSFVDIGLERDGFLYVTDVVPSLDAFEAATKARPRRASRRPPRPRAPSRPSAATPAVGAGEAGGETAKRRRGGKPQDEPKIEDLLKEGQDVMVQVVKEPLGDQGRPPDLARLAGRPLPRLHADGGSRRRVAQDRLARRAQSPARHRPRVPRAAGLHRRHHHPHGGLRPAEGRHPQRPGVLPQDVEGDPAEDRTARAPASSTGRRAWSPSCCATC